MNLSPIQNNCLQEADVVGDSGVSTPDISFFPRLTIRLYKIIQIVRALWLAIKPFYMSVCKHDFRSSFISYFIKEM